MKNMPISLKNNDKKSFMIILLLCLDLLLITLTFITVLTQIKYSIVPVFLLTLIQIAILVITIIYVKSKIFRIHSFKTFVNGKYNTKSSYRLQKFHKLMEDNLFQYHFQPIINSETGEIFGYEAQMRSFLYNIDMQPTEIVALAAKEKSLYQLERYTLLNCLKTMKEYSDIFKIKRLFIRHITNKQLNDEDFNILFAEYGPQFENVVFEITDAAKINEKHLELIRKRIKDANFQIAYDVYDLGNLNRPSLQKIAPDYIKINPSALPLINLDTKRQKQVSDLIGFAVHNNIKVIAGGVESFHEFEYMIKLGFEYIQGFYLSRQDKPLINTPSEDLLKKIHEINVSRMCEQTYNKIYTMNEETELSSVALAWERYTDIIINKSKITIQGNPGMSTDISLVIPNNHTCHIVLDNVHLNRKDKPAVLIGVNSKVIMELIGYNHFSCNGIRVPESSELTIIGDGNLMIAAEHIERIGIGGTADQSYGNITLALNGSIKILSTGNMSVGIGGGYNPADSLIRLDSGDISVSVSGYNTVGIGCISGNARIEINECRLQINTSATNVANIGSIRGLADITTKGEIDIISDGKYTVGIGVCEDSKGSVSVTGGTVNLNITTHSGAGIGSLSGLLNIYILNGDINIYGEGTDTVGIGGQTEFGKIKIDNGIISIQLYAANAVPIGNVQRNIVIDGGNIQCDFPDDIIPVNSYQSPLRAHIIMAEDEFRHVVETVAYSYLYRAKRSSRFPYIKVYLPDNILMP